MLTVIIPTHESEHALVRTLACLVPGATAGLVGDVILADAGSGDGTRAIGDVAGCQFLVLPGPLGMRLTRAAEAARQDWLMFLRPGTGLDPGWIAEVEGLVAGGLAAAATFRPGVFAPRGSMAAEALRLLVAAMGRRRPEQGLVIARRLYRELGGHRADAADPETELLRRLGRRVVTLRCAAGIT
jgi:glycosyltransferase involved in cell wall biosynthesis